jgi:hypothetical protein
MKAPAARFEDLVVWEKSAVCAGDYRLTRTFPGSERKLLR